MNNSEKTELNNEWKRSNYSASTPRCFGSDDRKNRTMTTNYLNEQADMFLALALHKFLVRKKTW